MAQLGTYRKLSPFKDEDKYGPFTKIQIAYGVIAVFLIVIEFSFFWSFYFPMAGFIVGFVIVAVAVVLNLKMPNDKYLMGGGTRIDVLLLRLITKRLFKRKLYVKNYDKKEEELL